MRALTAALMVALAVALVGCAPNSGTNANGAPTVASTPAPATPARPTRVRIPALNVESAVIDLGLQENGTMQVPPDAKDTGWYVNSPIPGLPGPAVLAAHVNWKGVDGPFAHLDQLKAGDDVIVENADGAEATFAITRVETYPKNDYPTDNVYADTPQPELRLITCGGPFDAAAHSYTDNIVAYAKLDT